VTAMADPERPKTRLSPEQERRRRQRNIAMAVALALLVLLFYAVSFVKGPGIAVRGF
jgi:hypothetical protein